MEINFIYIIVWTFTLEPRFFSITMWKENLFFIFHFIVYYFTMSRYAEVLFHFLSYFINHLKFHCCRCGLSTVVCRLNINTHIKLIISTRHGPQLHGLVLLIQQVKHMETQSSIEFGDLPLIAYSRIPQDVGIHHRFIVGGIKSFSRVHLVDIDAPVIFFSPQVPLKFM